MVRRICVIGLLAFAILNWSSCGGSSSSPSSTGPNPNIVGTLYTFLGDSPICDVLSLRMNVTDVTLGVAGSTTQTVIVLSPLSTVINLNLAALRDFSTVLALSSTAAATYDRVSVQLQAPTLVVYDPTQNPPFRTVTATLSTGTTPPLFTINPPLTIKQNTVSALNIDLNLEQMVGINSAGQFDGTITPAATATAPSASPAGGFGDLDGLEGFVRGVQTSGFGTSTAFTGAIVLQMLSSSVAGSGGPAVTAYFTKNTQVCMPPTASNQPCQAPASVAQILTDSYAAVDAFLDSNGNMNATSVVLEDVEDPTNSKIAFIGPILSLTKDLGGNVTGFTMFLRDQQPPSNFNIANDTLVQVNLSPSTLYEFSSPATNFASLPFAPSALAVGQEVVVHGTFTVPTTTPPSAVVTPDTIYLKLQTHEGNLESLVAVQPDDHTGAFTLFPCATMLQQGDAAALPIYVFTDSATSFVNTSGLTTLQSQPRIRVKGLLFLEPQSVTINGVTVPAGKLVMLAKTVTQLS